MSKIKKEFTSAKQLGVMINQYFTGSQSETKKTSAAAKSKTESFQAGPPTLAGLILHLGFNTREDFETLETKGIYASRLQRARLQIQALYERKLHQTSGGATYALKDMKRIENTGKNLQERTDTTFKVEVVQSGPELAGSEKEVSL